MRRLLFAAALVLAACDTAPTSTIYAPRPDGGQVDAGVEDAAEPDSGPRLSPARDAPRSDDMTTTNAEKAGHWLLSTSDPPHRAMSAQTSLRMAALYGPDSLDCCRLATEDEIHATIEAQLEDPAVCVIHACPCGRYAEVRREYVRQRA